MLSPKSVHSMSAIHRQRNNPYILNKSWSCLSSGFPTTSSASSNSFDRSITCVPSTCKSDASLHSPIQFASKASINLSNDICPKRSVCESKDVSKHFESPSAVRPKKCAIPELMIYQKSVEVYVREHKAKPIKTLVDCSFPLKGKRIYTFSTPVCVSAYASSPHKHNGR